MFCLPYDYYAHLFIYFSAFIKYGSAAWYFKFTLFATAKCKNWNDESREHENDMGMLYDFDGTSFLAWNMPHRWNNEWVIMHQQ